MFMEWDARGTTLLLVLHTGAHCATLRGGPRVQSREHNPPNEITHYMHMCVCVWSIASSSAAAAGFAFRYGAHELMNVDINIRQRTLP